MLHTDSPAHREVEENDAPFTPPTMNPLMGGRHGIAVESTASPPNRRRRGTPLCILLITMMLFSLFTPVIPFAAPVELADQPMRYAGEEVQMKLYNMYIDKRNSTAGGDGYLTTSTPDNGQANESALGATLEFRSRYLLSDMPIGGRIASGGGANNWEVPVSIFLRATAGSQGNTATYTFTLSIEDSGGSRTTLSTVQKEQSACDDLFGCGWNQEVVRLQWIGSQYHTIPEGGALTLEVSAESTCEGQSGGVFGPSCDAEVMWGEPDSSDDYSVMEFWSNAASQSQVRIYKEGALWTDPETLEWYPNALPDDRAMEVKINVIDALGREDVVQVSVQLRAPDGSYPVDHIFSNNELSSDDSSLVGSFVWNYPAGIQSGGYTLTLVVADVQGNQPFVFEHEEVLVKRYGVDVRNAADRSAEYIAPGETTPIQLVLRHTGESGSGLDVELDLLTNLGSNWLAQFDRPEGYSLSDGGDEATAQLTLEAPSELGTAPPRLDVSVRAFNSSGAEVHFSTYQITLDKLDVYAPPMLALWDSEHEDQIYNSTRPESFDVTVPQFVDDLGPPTPFFIEIFNTGFDSDSFRFEVTEKPRGMVYYFVDNQTGQVINQDTEDGLWHTPTLPRHTNYTIAMYLNPSSEPDDPDYGLMEVEVSSAGNASLTSIVQFTPHRTNGVQAVVVFDCDGASNGLGHVEYQNCEDDDSDEYIDVRMRIEATQTSGDENMLIDWRIINPADYERNAEGEGGRYTLWEYIITDVDGDPMPMFEMTSGDSAEFWLEVHLTNQVLAANHTIYLRIEEITDDDEAQRFFDLPISIEVGEGDPDLDIVQVSANQPMIPGTSTDYTMAMKNDGNTDMQVVLSTSSPDGWTAVAENPDTQSSLLLVPAFSEVTFTLKVTSSESARHGDFHTITVTGQPQSFTTGYSDEFNAEADIDVRVEINDPMQRISNELSNMRPTTMLMLGGLVILIVAAIAGKRRRASEWLEDDDFTEEDDDFDLPEAVTDDTSDDPVVSDDGDEEFDDLDDIELV